MIRNYFIIALRSLLKNKLFSFINIIGLALSMSVGVLVLIRMSDAFDYDTFHTDRENIYRIISRVTNKQGDSWKLASSPLPLGSSVANDQLQSTFIYPGIHSVVKDDSREFSCNGVFIEPSFFDVFGFSLSSGHAASLNAPQRLLVSEQFSKRFFGGTNPIGKIVTVENYGEFEISGVVKTPPSKSHIQYDIFVSMASANADKLQDWDSFELGYTYVRFNNETAKDILAHDLEQKAKEINSKSTEGKFEFELQSLSSISPSPSDLVNDIGRSPSLGSLIAEMSIVLVILVAACFNYTNLSIARALTRGKEIGIRKLSGATRLQIISQYVIEALVISLLALVIANIILAPILEYQPFNDGYEMIPELHVTWRFVGFVAAFTLITGLMAGVLPAWLLSSFRPVRVLRGIATEKLMGRMSLRKTLLVFQFSLSLVVLVFLSTFYQQFNFLASADPGFNRKNVILIPKGTHAEVTASLLSKISAVKTVGFTSGRFGNSINIPVSRERNTETQASFDYYACDEGWVKMMRLEAVAGSFSLDNKQGVVLNEKAVTTLGFQNADEAIGSMIYIHDSTRVTINGVVKNFYANGYGNAVKPIIFRADSSLFKMISVEGNYSSNSLVADIEKEWLKQNPAHAFDYTLLDDQMSSDNDQTATVSLLGFLGLITISSASLGLLGLVVYTIEVKRKEISVRKIIGASVQQLVALLSKGFLSLLGIAGAVALPIGFVMGELFLMNFANHISMSWLQLFGCFGLLLFIGLATILSQTIGAANEDPARNLRSE
jgi:putative ABC transport system permease protein